MSTKCGEIHCYILFLDYSTIIRQNSSSTFLVGKHATNFVAFPYKYGGKKRLYSQRHLYDLWRVWRVCTGDPRRKWEEMGERERERETNSVAFVCKMIEKNHRNAKSVYIAFKKTWFMAFIASIQKVEHTL